jgi:hypothetical protein
MENSEKRIIVRVIINHVHNLGGKGCRAETILRLCGVQDELLFCKTERVRRGNALCKKCVGGMSVEDYMLKNVDLGYYNDHVRCKYYETSKRCVYPEYKDGKCKDHFCELCNGEFDKFKQSFYYFLLTPFGEILPKDLKIMLFDLVKPTKCGNHWTYWPREYSDFRRDKTVTLYSVEYISRKACDPKTCNIKIPDVCMIYMPKYSREKECSRCRGLINLLNVRKVDKFITENIHTLTGNSYVDFVLQNMFTHPEKITFDSLRLEYKKNTGVDLGEICDSLWNDIPDKEYAYFRDHIILIARLILESLEEKFKKQHPDINIYVSRGHNFLVEFLFEKLSVSVHKKVDFENFSKICLHTFAQ